MAYEAPQVEDFGSIEELTAQSFNKVGASADVLTQLVEQVVGSFVGI